MLIMASGSEDISDDMSNRVIDGDYTVHGKILEGQNIDKWQAICKILT